ncbi:MAG TPA: hypothetical protein VGE05_15520 [Novosphingobium sp.]
MTHPSLTAVIIRFKAESYALHAKCYEAEERGEEAEEKVTFWPLIRQLEAWSRPAESLPEALLALELAIEDYEIGPTDRIPAMMKAVLGWLKSSGAAGREARLRGQDEVKPEPFPISSVVESLHSYEERMSALHMMCSYLKEDFVRMGFRRIIEDAETAITKDLRALKSLENS